MPAFVRNFWVEVYIDGRKTNFKGGPRRKDGGMVISILQRDKGGIKAPCTIYCSADENGTLVTEFEDNTIGTITPILRTVR